MTLYKLLKAAQYMQVFSIYVTNVYDQNIPIARGTFDEMMKQDTAKEYILFDYLMCAVDYFHITDKKVMVVFIKDECFETKAEHQYSEQYVEKWDITDAKTRPYLFRIETEEYTEDYLWKFEKN